jgi:hypothetical protein
MSSTSEALQVLRQVRALRGLPDTALRTLAADTESRTYQRGSVIGRQGEDPEAVVLMRSGHASVLRKLGSGGRVLVVEQAACAHVFFARAVVHGGKAAVSLVCETPCSVILIRREALAHAADRAVRVALIQAEAALPSDDALLEQLEHETSWEVYTTRLRDTVVAEHLWERSATRPTRPRCDPAIPAHALRASIGGHRRATFWVRGTLEAVSARSQELLAERVAEVCAQDDSLGSALPNSLKSIEVLAAEALAHKRLSSAPPGTAGLLRWREQSAKRLERRKGTTRRLHHLSGADTGGGKARVRAHERAHLSASEEGLFTGMSELGCDDDDLLSF